MIAVGRVMPILLSKRPFQPADIYLPAVQNFDCGTEPWELEVSDWIKGKPGGVLDDLNRAGSCEVWLYGTAEDGLVGFASLSEPSWGYPNRSDPKPNLIPMLGIQRQFRGKPDGLKGDRYSAQIMDDIIAEARKHMERVPAIVLYVHPNNLRAIQFYRDTGFQDYHRTFTDQKSGD